MFFRGWESGAAVVSPNLADVPMTRHTSGCIESISGAPTRVIRASVTAVTANCVHAPRQLVETPQQQQLMLHVQNIKVHAVGSVLA